MRALAQHMGKERDYEVLISCNQPLLPPPGASEVDVKAWQVQYNYYLHYFCVQLYLVKYTPLPLSFTNCWRAPSATWSERCRGGLTESWPWWFQSELDSIQASLQVPKKHEVKYWGSTERKSEHWDHNKYILCCGQSSGRKPSWSTRCLLSGHRLWRRSSSSWWKELKRLRDRYSDTQLLY